MPLAVCSIFVGHGVEHILYSAYSLYLELSLGALGSDLRLLIDTIQTHTESSQGKKVMNII